MDVISFCYSRCIMKGFMIVGATYDSCSGSLCGFLLHIDGKPFVTESVEQAVITAKEYLHNDLKDYDNVEFGHYENLVYGVNYDIEVQYKIVSLDGSVVLVNDFLTNN